VERRSKTRLGRGAKVVFGGGRRRRGLRQGLVHRADHLENVPDGARMWTEEVFGPAASRAQIKDLDEGLRLPTTRVRPGLAIWTASMAAAHRA